MHTSTLLQAMTVGYLATSAAAHMIMATPVPYSADKIDSGPITRSQFPCKANLGFNVTKENEMKVGDSQTLSFKGSAVHGGGSCQLVVTQDRPPTANSKFKVIQSIEGGCPGVDGPATFNFTLPPEVPNGKVSFAWTWFAKLSGSPEMYMNCAPVTVSGGAKDASGLDSFPDMFVANLDGNEGCQTPVSHDTTFPDPGKDLEKGSAFSPGDLTKCGAGSNPPDGESSAGGAAPTSAGTAPTSADGGGNNGLYTGDGAAATSAPPANNGGGVFAPSALPSEVASPTPSAAGPSDAPPANPTSTLTTLITVTGGAADPTPAVPTPVPTPQPSDTPSTPGSGTACATDGALVCNGASQWGLCDHGNVVWQAVAPGTTCANGAIQARKMRRDGWWPRARAARRGFQGVGRRV